MAREILTWLTSPRAVFFFGEIFFNLVGMRLKNWGSLSQVKRVLVVRLDEIGDVVMTIPFLRELRHNLIESWITLIVKSQLYNLVELCPYVNEVVIYDGEVNGRFVLLRRHGRALLLAWRHLWRHRFELAIVPRWDTDYYHASFVAYLSGATWRVGYSENVNPHKKQLNKGYDRLFTHLLYENSPKHEVEHNLEIIRFLGGKVENDKLELWIEEDDKEFARQFLKRHRVKSDDLLISIAPGAGAPKRQWPVERFIELGSWLKKTYKARLLVTGGEGEEILGERMKEALGDTIINAVGRTTLRQTVALLKFSRLFVGNDAGPMHMAAAVSIPIVMISCHPKTGSPLSPNSPSRFRPWKVPHKILQPESPQPPCVEECVADYPHCIRNVKVEEVKKAIEEILSSRVEKL